MITVTSKNDKYAMDVTNGTAAIVSDVPVTHGGSGKYLAPFDLLCSSFACCLTATARMLLEKRGVAYESVTAKVAVDKETTPGITAFTYDIDIKGDIPEADLAKYKAMIFKGCPVHKALDQKITFDGMK